ncbi:MAG: hypothetical protein ACYCY5_14065, partial [Sulfuricella sp.]
SGRRLGPNPVSKKLFQCLAYRQTPAEHIALLFDTASIPMLDQASAKVLCHNAKTKHIDN